ncbi:MAG: YihY/virulence factor BrkB family protein [Anaerolineae bacterium]|nr:YihY/virulence factor BrkB family protein [Anaerolineae bacterium]
MDLPQRLQDLKQRVEVAYARADAAAGGRIGVVRQALNGFALEHSGQAAASMAYYTLLSLFPLLLLLTVLGSLFVDTQQVRTVILEALSQILPPSLILDRMMEVVDSVLAARAEVSILGVLVLMWSASGAFTTLTYNVDRAWSRRRRSSPVKARLIGLLMIVLLYFLLLVVLVASPLLAVLYGRPLLFLAAFGVDDVVVTWLPRAVAAVVTFLALANVYRWVPRPFGPWRACLMAGLLAALALQALNLGFRWFLLARLGRYELIYGSLATITLVMLWIYLSASVVFLGAHLAAAMADRRDEPRA